MSKPYFSAIIITAAIIALSAFALSKRNKTRTLVPGIPGGFAVIELFTSEGCSSCPPADEVVARLLSKNIQNVFILSYHVDYWDKLGWKDPFSKSIYSQRQQQYATAFKLDGVYTPQIVVNGTSEFVGSDEQKLITSVQNNLSGATNSQLDIDLKKGGTSLTVNYTTRAKITGEKLLTIALLQPKAKADIKKGENSGRTLQHVNIVRALKIIDADIAGTVKMEIPGELEGIPLQLIAFIQDESTWQISAVAQKGL